MSEKPVVTTNNGLFPVLAANVQNQQNSRFIVSLYHPVVVLRPGRPEVRILPVAPRAAPYGVLLFLFCMDFMGQQKGGFEQPVPRALRPAGQKRPSGNFLFFVVCMMSLFRLPRGKLPLALLAVPTGKDGRVECPRQTVNDFIGIRGSVCGLFLFVQTHAPLDICEQHTMCLISVSHIVIHLPPSITANSSWVINSLPQCQVMNSKNGSHNQRISLCGCHSDNY